MIEHEAHIGSKYQDGIDGQRVAIIGFSHWGEIEEDDNSGTKNCIHNVMTGEWKIRFFTSIRNYFQYTDHALFWDRVMFFNFLPDCVGGPDQRFGNGTPEQIKRRQARFLRLIGAECPHKALVFTSRRRVFPKAESADAPLNCPFSAFSKRTYHGQSFVVPTFFLRHPQGANGKLMRDVVSHVRMMPIATRI